MIRFFKSRQSLRKFTSKFICVFRTRTALRFAGYLDRGDVDVGDLTTFHAKLEIKCDCQRGGMTLWMTVDKGDGGGNWGSFGAVASKTRLHVIVLSTGT